MKETFPPPNYISVKSAINGIEVFKPKSPEEDQRPIVDFKCPQCGATTAYSIANGGLLCTYCGYYEAPQAIAVGKRAEEFEFKVETMEQAAQGWGTERRELACQRCGAKVSIPVDLLTYTCPFCGSNKVLQQQASQDGLRPRFLVPFKVDPQACKKIVIPWLSSNWMTPGTLKQVTQIGVFTPIYIPLWTFSASCTADWQAEVGHTETERAYEDGQWKTRTKTVWKRESGQVHTNFDDILIEGTTHVSKKLLDQIKNYDLQGLVSYKPEYLAGIQAQAYDVTLDKAWEVGRNNMRENTRQACRSQANTTEIRNFNMNLDFSGETWRYILLPINITAYEYNGLAYQIMINGQTGAISGQRPVAWGKVWLVILALLSPGVILGMLGLITLPLGGIGAGIGGFGFFLLVIGLIIASIIFFRAQGLDDA